jgi:hypothetical protein
MRRRSTDTGARSRDLDETRRLAYAALVKVDDKRDRELAGTLVNALVHHQEAATDEEALAQVAVLLNNPANPDARQWMLEHVKRINAELT